MQDLNDVFSPGHLVVPKFYMGTKDSSFCFERLDVDSKHDFAVGTLILARLIDIHRGLRELFVCKDTVGLGTIAEIYEAGEVFRDELKSMGHDCIVYVVVDKRVDDTYRLWDGKAYSAKLGFLSTGDMVLIDCVETKH